VDYLFNPGSFEGQFEVSGPAKVDRNGSNSTEELEPFSFCAPPEWSFPTSKLKCETISFCQLSKLFRESVLRECIGFPPRKFQPDCSRTESVVGLGPRGWQLLTCDRHASPLWGSELLKSHFVAFRLPVVLSESNCWPLFGLPVCPFTGFTSPFRFLNFSILFR